VSVCACVCVCVCVCVRVRTYIRSSRENVVQSLNTTYSIESYNSDWI